MKRRGDLTDLQKESLKRLGALPDDGWHRATYAGERVTLASLHTRGLAKRQAWRKSTAPAYEYRLSDALQAAVDIHRARRAAA